MGSGNDAVRVRRARREQDSGRVRDEVRPGGEVVVADPARVDDDPGGARRVLDRFEQALVRPEAGLVVTDDQDRLES